MHILEKQMLDLYHKNKNYLSGNSHIIITNINQQITSLLNDFNFLKYIPKSYFKIHFNLHIPKLSIEDIYTNLDKIYNISDINEGKLNYENISDIIISLKTKLSLLLENYNNFYGDIDNSNYQWSKICFNNNKIFIVKTMRLLTN